MTFLVLYYRLFLMENLGEDFDVFKDHLLRINEEISIRIRLYYPNWNKIAGYLREVSSRQNIKVTVYDVDGNRLWSADGRKSFGLSLELKNFTVVDRNVIYVVELVFPFSIGNLGDLGSIRKVGVAALVLLTIVIGLLIVYLHFSLVRPLTSLNRRLEAVNYHHFQGIAPVKIPKRRDELGDLIRKFEAMQQRLAASYRQQTEIIASISHDLKTPLTSIIGFLERLMQRRIPEERQTEYHRIIYQKARDIQDLIAEFKDYTDITGSDGKETVDLRQFLEAIAAEYKIELAGKGIIFQSIWEFDAGMNFAIEIDSQKIRRVFANLIGNSLKHGKGLSKIILKCGVRDGKALIAIEDDGPGVPPQELASIFEKFYRVDKSRSREKGGSGLGLAICQKIIESQGGSISAYLNQEGGLGVIFSLPLKAL